jgi:hypothetical protein
MLKRAGVVHQDYGVDDKGEAVIDMWPGSEHTNPSGDAWASATFTFVNGALVQINLSGD